MKCRNCSHRFSAEDGQPAPGGSSAPGCFFPFTVGSIVGAVWLAFVIPEIWWFVMLLPLIFIAINLLALYDCKGPGIGGTPGNQCPECGTRNTMWPWSM